jgi:hypothetical protein
MRQLCIVLSALLLAHASIRVEERSPDWVKVTDKAAWQPRGSCGEVVFQDKL